MPRRIITGFIPIIPDRTTKWTVTIDGTDVSDYLLSGNFPMGLISEELVCDMEIDDSAENYKGRFLVGHEIVFKMDFSGGSTIQFDGEVEEVKAVMEGGFFKLNIKGAHWTARFLDVLVTEDFSNANISAIRTSLISTYATGFTSTNVEANTSSISTKFVNKPLLDCFIELDKLGKDDTYVDNDKDVHSFRKNSKQNLNIHFVSDDSLLELRGLGQDSATVRNRINVEGDADGIPVIYRSDDSDSQATYRTKESHVSDTSIADEDQAEGVGDAEKAQLKNPPYEGSVLSLFWANIRPGEKAYIISQPHGVHDLFRIVKFVFHVPDETMDVYFNEERTIPKLFKDRINKDQSQEQVVNPFKMTRSYTFTFDNEGKIDTAASSGYVIENGIIRKDTSVDMAIIISNEKTSDITGKSFHLKIKGEVIDGATYKFQSDAISGNYQAIEPNATSITTASNPGSSIRLKIEITNNSTRIDGAGLYWKA